MIEWMLNSVQVGGMALLLTWINFNSNMDM